MKTLILSLLAFNLSLPALAGGYRLPEPPCPDCWATSANSDLTSTVIFRFGKDVASCVAAPGEFPFLNRGGAKVSTSAKCEVEAGTHEHVVRLELLLFRNTPNFTELMNSEREFKDLTDCIGFEKKVEQITAALPAALQARFVAACNVVSDTGPSVPQNIRYIPSVSFIRGTGIPAPAPTPAQESGKKRRR